MWGRAPYRNSRVMRKDTSARSGVSRIVTNRKFVTGKTCQGKGKVYSSLVICRTGNSLKRSESPSLLYQKLLLIKKISPKFRVKLNIRVSIDSKHQKWTGRGRDPFSPPSKRRWRDLHENNPTNNDVLTVYSWANYFRQLSQKQGHSKLYKKAKSQITKRKDLFH